MQALALIGLGLYEIIRLIAGTLGNWDTSY